MDMSLDEAEMVLDVNMSTLTSKALVRAYSQRLINSYRTDHGPSLVNRHLSHLAYETLAPYVSETDDYQDPQIYVEVLPALDAKPDYRYHCGRWIGACQSMQDLEAEIQRILVESPQSPVGGWSITDTRGFNCEMAPIETLKSLHQKACLIMRHRNLARKLLDRYLDAEAVQSRLEHRYCGEYPSRQAFIKAEFDRYYPGAIAESSKKHIDYQAFGDKVFEHHEVIELGDRWHVFSNDPRHDMDRS